MKKVLYVEDDKDTAEAVEILLRNSGFDSKIANSGKECMEILDLESFDLIILDVMLPDMSGWDIFETLRDRKIKSKIAFLSALPISSSRMQELKNAGISDYITKPFNRKILVEKINTILIEKNKIIQKETKKILYVEDDKDTAEAVKSMLNHAGFKTEIVCNGKECLNKTKEKFDLILLDMMLPDMSGWDIFETLKQNKNIKAKMAFLSSIEANKARINELKHAGVADYINKPFQKKELIDRIKKILNN
ncbi:response regulator [Candidatus Pacearchaeota archaeon]|nr:response regulator [Candidatus Pacearchaeota archaeon]